MDVDVLVYIVSVHVDGYVPFQVDVDVPFHVHDDVPV